MCDLEFLHSKTLTKIRDYAQETHEAFKTVQQYSTKSDQQGQARDKVIKTLADRWFLVLTEIGPVVTYALGETSKLHSVTQELLEKFQSFDGEVQKRFNSARDLDQRAEEVLTNAETASERIQTMAAEEGISFHAFHFKREADRYERASKIWLTTVRLTTHGRAATDCSSISYDCFSLAAI